MNRLFNHILFCATILVLAGCQKQGPVELFDDGFQSQELVVENVRRLSDGVFGVEDLDTLGRIPDVPSRIFGQMTLIGSVFHSPTDVHESSLARAVFFDRLSPLILHNDTVAYHTQDAGTVLIDDIPLYQTEKRFRLRGNNGDTILGVQYALVNNDRVGGRGFQFIGGHAYHWNATGSGTIPSFSVDITSPPDLVITSLNASDGIDVNRDLPVRWRSGNLPVKVLISEVVSVRRTRPVLQLRTRTNRDGILIPSTILRLFRDKSALVLTFSSQTSEQLSVPGFGEEIRVRAISSQSYLMPINR